MKVFPALSLQGGYLYLAGVIVQLSVAQRMNVGYIPNKLTVEDHMKRSYSILLLTGMVLALFISACGGGSSGSSGSSNQPQTVTIWHGWAGNYVAPKQAIFDAYTKLHPNVTIKLVNLPQPADTEVDHGGSGQQWAGHHRLGR